MFAANASQKQAYDNKPFDDTQRAIVHGNISVFLSEKSKGVWKIDSIYDDVKKVEKIERAAAV